MFPFSFLTNGGRRSSNHMGCPDIFSDGRHLSLRSGTCSRLSCTVFDFGTTLTIDFVGKEGEYLGGNISPGYRTRFKALNRYARGLPLLETPAEAKNIGGSILTSMEAGVILGIMFEIMGYLSQFPENTVVFTGGDAIYFAKRMKNPIFVICNLVMMGLALIADEYVGKNGI